MTAPKPRESTENLEGLGGFSTEEMAFIWQRLDDGQRKYITGYYERIRKLNQQATDAWNKRASRLSFLLDYCKVNDFTEHNTREKILNDWRFNDANDDWLRFGREVRRCESAIRTELMMTYLLKGGIPSAR